MNEKFTKGPWRWEVNEKHKNVELCGKGIEVLRFERWGMQGAQPTFTKYKDDTFKLQGMKVTDVSVEIKGREHHSHWCKTINHPDAHLIAAAPDMYRMLKGFLDYKDSNGAKPAWVDDVDELLAKARGEL